jgi:glycosyltransferase involved in cell wall biosynthesis
VRLAWFSPWPPQKSGVAGRSAEVVPLLAGHGHAIDVMVDAASIKVDPSDAAPPEAGRVRILGAHDFSWRRLRDQYDLAVYQIGNSHLHRYIWPYVFREPGLAVLHDACVHHARAEALLSRERDDDYRAEFAWSHPDSPPDIAELAVVGVQGPFYYRWPMIRGVVESARLVACHSRGVVTRLEREYPGRPVAHIALGYPAGPSDANAAGAAFRRAHGLPADAVVFGVFGGLTAEKRVELILPAFAATRAWASDARLLLAGAPHAALELDRRIDDLGLRNAVCLLPSADDAEFNSAIAASDVALNLRWPSARETSGPWVQCLALGKPTVVIDLEHQTHVPSLDPRTWQVRPSTSSADADAAAVTVAIEVLDVKHSLLLAMRRLAHDASLRNRLGAAARAWWAREHTMDRMLEDYERALARAVTESIPHPDWPAHMRPDPAAHAGDLLAGSAWDADVVGERISSLKS